MSETASHFVTSAAAVGERNQVHTRFDLVAPMAAGEVRVPIAELEQLADEYLLDCEYRQHRPHTIANNRGFLRHFSTFLKGKGHRDCGKPEIRLFLHYLQQPRSSWRQGC